MAITATFFPNSRELFVYGDGTDNTITASRNAAGVILINGGAVQIQGGTPNVGNTDGIYIRGYQGRDVIAIDETNGAMPPVNVPGYEGNKVVTGGSGSDLFSGGHGNDFLDGRGGADFLLGGAGEDTLQGGAGDDALYGNTGNDHMFGDGGNDRLIWSAGDGSDVMEGGDGIEPSSSTAATTATNSASSRTGGGSASITGTAFRVVVPSSTSGPPKTS
jgi:Ca2+-binding RTX toxin-like protein